MKNCATHARLTKKKPRNKRSDWTNGEHDDWKFTPWKELIGCEWEPTKMYKNDLQRRSSEGTIQGPNYDPSTRVT